MQVCILYLLPQHVVAQARLECQWRHALICQCCFIAFLVEFSTILKSLDAAYQPGYLLIRHNQSRIPGTLQHQPLRDQIFNHRALHFLTVEHGRIKVVSHLLPQPVLLLTQRISQLLLGNFCAIHRGCHFCRIARTGI